jgi:hypothetical protein
MIEGTAAAVAAALLPPLLPHARPSGVPDNGQAFEPAKGSAKDSKAKKQPGALRHRAMRAIAARLNSVTRRFSAFPTASLPKPVKSSAKGKGGGGGDGGKEGGKGRKMYFD